MTLGVLFSALLLSCVTHATTNSGQRYLPEDVTAITLYGAGTNYRPDLCPKEISFMARASKLPGLSPGRLGLLPSDIMADGEVCSADVAALDMFPIGDVRDHTRLPPQWIFEDSSMQDKPINLTCGTTTFSIMYGYFNDVKAYEGRLDPNIAYFDFAVYPYIRPFSYCSYANRMKKDGWRPLHRAPFPLESVWNQTRDYLIENSVPDPASSPDVNTQDESSDDGGNSNRNAVVDNVDISDDTVSRHLKTDIVSKVVAPESA